MAVTGSIKSNNIVKSDFNYRKLQALNQSMLRVWDENPALFFEQFKLGKLRKDRKTAASILGDISHFYTLDCNGSDIEFENNMHKKFGQFLGEKGTGQVFILCDILFEVTEECMNENGVITQPLDVRFQTAFDRIKAMEKYKGKDIDAVFTDFEKNGKDYFQALMNNAGKTVVTPVQIEKGKFLGKLLMNDSFTSHFFKGNIHTSFPIEWTYNNTDCTETLCKSEIDLFKIDDKNKKIYLVDLKFTWDNEGFEYSYLKNYYYIQQAFYYLAAMFYFTHIQPEYHDYKIVPMQYVAVDTSLNNRRPLVYPCSGTDLKAGLDGFKLGHRYYKGVHELMSEICWAENTGNWNISKKAFESKGILPLTFDYEFN